MNITNKIILIGIGVGALFWIVETFLEAFVFYHGGGFFYYLFPLEPHIIWHRLVVIILLIVFGLLAHFSILEREKSEKEIIDSEKKYRTLIDNALVGTYKTNLKGDILYANEALTKMFKFDSLEEMMQNGVLARYKNPKDREVLIEGLKRTGWVEGFRVEVLTKTGKAIDVLVSATLEGDAISGMIIDITKSRKLEDALIQRLKELEEFHEMAIERELKMIKLKEEIERLKEELKKHR